MNKLILIGLALLLMLPISVFGAINDNLTVYYSFDNTTKQWYEDLTPTTFNIVNFANSNTTNITGKIGSARNIGGAGYLLTPNDTRIFPASDTGYGSVQKGRTYVWWSYQTTLTGSQYHFYNGNNALIVPGAHYSNAGGADARTFQRPGVADAELVTTAHSSGVWTFNVVIVNSFDNNFTYYRNAVHQGTGSVTSTTLASGYGITIGSYFGGGSYMSGYIDEFAIWNRTLTTAEISYLYNSGNGRSCAEINCTITIPATNATVTAFNFYNSTTITTFNVYNNATLIASTTNGTAYLPYLTNTSSLFNLTIESFQHQLYYNQSYTNQNVSSNLNASLQPYYITNNIFYARDFYTGTNLTNFSITDQFGNVTSTTNGVINATLYAQYQQFRRYNITYSSTQNGGYFNQSYSNLNTTTTTNTNMSQSVITFSATQYISNATISGANFTSQYVTNTTQYLTAGTWLINATKTGYFTKSQNYTAVALSSASVTIQNMTDTRLNLTVRNIITNAVVTSWAVQLNNSAYGHSETRSTTTGALVVDSLSGNWTALVDASGYALTLSNLTLSAGLNNVTIYVYTSESINFFFYNEQTGALITNPNVTIELIGSYASYNRTTNGTGTTYIDLITPDAYIARYYANGYNSRFSYISVGSRTTQNVSLYLLSAVNGTNISIDVLQQDGTSVQSALVKVLKYDLASNSYVVREQVLTDYNGRAYADVLYNQEFYKFIVEYPVGTVALETDPAYITSTSLTLIIDTGLAGTFYTYIQGAGGDVSFNTATNNFRFTWSDTAGVVTQSCLNVYSLADNYTATYLGQNCSTSSAGTLLYAVSNATQSQYYGVGYFVISGTSYKVDEAFADLRSNNYFGLLGVLIAVALTVTLTFVLIKVSPQAAILSVPLGVTVTNLTGITQFAVWVPFGLFAVCLIIVFAMGRDK